MTMTVNHDTLLIKVYIIGMSIKDWDTLLEYKRRIERSWSSNYFNGRLGNY